VLRHGLSDFDVRHVAVLSYTWLVPGPAFPSGLAGWLASGWQLGGIYQASSGLPFTPIIGGDPLRLNSIDTFASGSSLYARLRIGCQSG
jgi:hypothetical protein